MPSFEERKKLAVSRKQDLFSVFNQKLTVRENEGLKYLFVFMPLNDLADYNGNFLLANIDISLNVR